MIFPVLSVERGPFAPHRSSAFFIQVLVALVPQWYFPDFCPHYGKFCTRGSNELLIIIWHWVHLYSQTSTYWKDHWRITMNLPQYSAQPDGLPSPRPRRLLGLAQSSASGCPESCFWLRAMWGCGVFLILSPSPQHSVYGLSALALRVIFSSDSHVSWIL